MIKTKDIAWLAGILEGEGSFGLTNKGRSPCIWLAMTDRDVVERVRMIVDPTLSISITEDNRKESYKNSYHLTVNGPNALGWMMTIYSLMGERRKLKLKEILVAMKGIVYKQSQIRTMRPAARLVMNMMKLGITKEQAYTEVLKLQIH